MTDDFKPPIKSRSTEDLLKIVGAPKKWNPIAFKLAENELYNRKVDSKKIEQAKYLENKRDRIETSKIANESFNFFSLDPTNLFINWSEIFMFLFSWEYEKDGFLKKASIQRKYRPIILLFILVIIIYTFVS
ncbi:hypothetical protein [Flavobacterium aquatile]|uniref:Uncharacterized protein n=1 Tax=Flavobacterium aquatile LMG 4008 = ATCC 11947 TaxID=1453498 RepID=A0A095SWV5_9FLAO|nr:hypothetical protein [Flavobacterium aquatile]KGD69151.1 hypothetical protein LG45_05835 [Flavobacterium aquatile LMG 4008 = ATCC 11947]OXA65860.1 hypothetical protein B0A61_14570 [Flavobacterium aquatile LMG 4008 = ATCC 11947]GEC79682.1 hypothetical protein FAQ01_25520 [Flavobacterium aquatile]